MLVGRGRGWFRLGGLCWQVVVRILRSGRNDGGCPDFHGDKLGWDDGECAAPRVPPQGLGNWLLAVGWVVIFSQLSGTGFQDRRNFGVGLTNMNVWAQESL